MSKDVLGIRIDSTTKEALTKRAMLKNVSLSSYASEILKQALEETDRMDMLIRNIHEECLQIEDMITLMQGFNIEVYATILGRTELKYNSKEERAEGARKRNRAFEGMKSCIDIVASKITSGENVWEGETKL